MRRAPIARCLAVLALICLAVMTAAVSVHAAVIDIPNSGFETENAGWTCAKTKIGADASCEWVTDPVFSGERAVSMSVAEDHVFGESPTYSNDSVYWTSETVLIPDGYSKVKASVMLKAANLQIVEGGLVRASIEFLKADGSRASKPDFADHRKSPTLGDEWIEWSGTLTIPADAESLRVSMIMTGATGSIWMDDFTVAGVDETPPTVSITAPANNAKVRSVVTVEADATDVGDGVAGVQFMLDGENLGAEDTAAPFEINWDTTTYSNGEHILTAIARDGAGNTSQLASVTVTVDNTLPAVSITAPTEDAVVNGSVIITAQASDNLELAEVLLKLGEADLGTAQLSGDKYTYTWDTTEYDDGAYDIIAVARDAAGNEATATVSVVVDNTGPVVSFLAPPAGAAVKGTYGITVSASDPSDVAGVQLKLDGANLGSELTTAPYTYEWNTLGLNGSYQLTAVARDTVGNEATATVSVFVDNTPPMVSVAAPLPGAFVRDSVNIELNIIENHEVALVKFMLSDASGTIELGSTTTGTYTWDTTPYDDGPKTIWATVRDAAGNETPTAPLPVIVDNTPPEVSIAAPLDGASVKGTIDIEVEVSDMHPVVGALQLDGAELVAGITGWPYTCTWDTTGWDGTHVLTVVAHDPAGNEATATVSVLVDNEAPSVSITAPEDFAWVKGSIDIEVDASDNNAIAGVQLKLNGSDLGSEVTSDPYTYTWDTTGLNGDYVLTAVARDAAGNETTSTEVSVTVDNTAPEVTITAPSDGATVMGTVNVAVEASDNNAVVGIQLQLNGVDWGEEITADSHEFSWDTTGVNNGEYQLAAIARDVAGNTTTAVITVTVDNPNQAPAVSIVKPQDGDKGLGTQEIEWTATDSDGDDLSISLYYAAGSSNDWLEIATGLSNTGEYQWSTQGIPGGIYRIKVVAEDQTGAVGEAESGLFAIASASGGSQVNHGPNPAADSVTFYFAADVYGTLYVMDITGRQVAALPVPAGTTHLSWNLLSNQGKPLASGLYLYLVVKPDGTSTAVKRLVIER